MGERIKLGVFRGLSEQRFRETATSIASKGGGSIQWDTEPSLPKAGMRTSATDKVLSVDLPYLGGVEFLFFVAIAKALDVVWMSLRIQEGSLWDYSLFHADRHLHSFSTWPEYWDDDPEFIESQRGNVEQLSGCWGCDRHRVERYLVRWTDLFDPCETLPQNHAYPTDAYKYGDIWQMLDFLRALGGADPLYSGPGAKQHALTLPEANVFQERTGLVLP
jgi:hypothetical protein